jgi:hypothetical protein
MKISTQRKEPSAFTLHEIMVAVGCATVASIMLFGILNVSTVLYAKVTSINLAHDEARLAVNRLVNDIHKAVSQPQLWDASATTTAGLVKLDPAVPPPGFDPKKVQASCVSFQLVPPNGGPYEVKNDPGNANMIQIQTMVNGFDPKPGMRLIIPMYDIENDLIQVTSESQSGQNHRNVWMANEEEKIPKSKGGTKIMTYFTTRVFYAVENGSLNTYASGVNGNGILVPALVGGKLVIRNKDGTAAKPTTIARYVTSPQPFSAPSYPDRRYIGVNLTTEESRYSNRGYKAVNTLVAGSIPYRARLCDSL